MELRRVRIPEPGHPADGIDYALSGGFSLGDWRFDAGSQRLTRGDRSQALDPKESSVLQHLAEAAPAVVSRDALMSRTWRHVVVGDHVLHVVVARLRKALGDDARHPRYIETLAKRGYRLVVPVKVLRQPAPPMNRSLAVLPVEAAGAEGELTSYANGLTQELRCRIATYQELQAIVLPRESWPAVTPPAAYLVSGSVQPVGRKVRTRFELIRSSDRQAVWSATFTDDDRDADPASKAAITGRFVRLQVARDQQCQEVRRKSRSAEAAELVCTAIDLNYRINQQGQFDPSLLRATAERAIVLDDKLLEAYQLLPTAYYFQAAFGEITSRKASELAHRALDRALAIDPGNAYTLWSLGFVQAQLDLDYTAAEESLRRAIANDPLHPNARWFHAARGTVAKIRGDLSSALDHYRRAVRIFDSDGRVQGELADTLYFAGEHRDAIAAANAALALSPYALAAWLAAQSKFHAYLALAEPETAERTLDDYLRCADPNWRPYAASMLALVGRSDAARRYLAALEKRARSPRYPLILGYAALGELDPAFRHLECGIERTEPMLLARVRTDPALARLRRESRWTAVMQLLESLEAAGVWPRGSSLRPTPMTERSP